MFEKFTSDAREAVIAAQREARHLKATRIEPVHVFLGVIASAKPGLRDALEGEGYTSESVRSRLSDGIALGDGDSKALESIGIDLDAVRASLEATFGEGALDPPTRSGGGCVESRGTSHSRRARRRHWSWRCVRLSRTRIRKSAVSTCCSACFEALTKASSRSCASLIGCASGSNPWSRSGTVPAAIHGYLGPHQLGSLA